MAADIVIYDLAQLKSLPRRLPTTYRRTSGDGCRRLKGIGGSWWNGEVIFADGQCTGATPGKLLRNGQAV